MDTRTRGKVIAQVAGAGLIAASTLGAAALALETYQDANHQQAQNTAATGTDAAKDTSGVAGSATRDTGERATGSTADTGPSTTYVQAPPAGAGHHGSSSGS